MTPIALNPILPPLPLSWHRHRHRKMELRLDPHRSPSVLLMGSAIQIHIELRKEEAQTVAKNTDVLKE
jgi:hypothetical protein